ncbi:MAG: primosomal protein N' [Bacteroidota bacterium]
MFAEVILPLALPKTFTYAIPQSLIDSAVPGVRVEVVFGRQKRYAGIIKSVTHIPPQGFQVKPILQVLDTEPILHPQQLQLWSWIATYYMCTEGEVMAAALPAHFKLNSETVLVFNEAYGDDFSALDEQEFLVAEGLLLKKELKIDEVQGILDIGHVYPVVRRLLEKNICHAYESIREKYIPKREKVVSLHVDYHNESALEALLNNWSGKAPKQMELLLSFLHLQKSDAPVRQTELLKKAAASPAQLRSLVDKNILIVSEQQADRIPMGERRISVDVELSTEQQQAWESMQSQFSQKETCLLYGVTSSGKTLLYIKLMEQAVRNNTQVLFLLPEIALTSQIIRRLQQHFGGYIAIYHSKFNPNERVEIWNKIRSGEAKIIIGARSALFLPFVHLTHIIIDEEQDASFKQQDPAPRYNARDAALYYATLFSAKVLLGSATPSLESYAHASSGKYGLVKLLDRFGGVALPTIEVIDHRQHRAEGGMRSIVTPALKEAITESLRQKKQVILFQNRRGYAPYKMCATCGNIPHCEQCDVTLSYHKLQHKLKCHYCGTAYPVQLQCAACGSAKWVERNFGTEKVEEELAALFPSATIARMDVDTVKGKTAHEEMIKNFEQRRMDILVGTQMVVKGLDFEHVALVGILDADGLLSFTDFRVNERAFQLMEQVSGRAGRRGEQGRVLIQTAQPHHPLIGLVVQHDYTAMYELEMKTRKVFHYPPYSRIIQFTFRHVSQDMALHAARFFANHLHSSFADTMIGPAEPVVNRIKNRYIYEILLKLPREGTRNGQARVLIQQVLTMLEHDKAFRSVQVQINVDPQ